MVGVRRPLLVLIAAAIRQMAGDMSCHVYGHVFNDHTRLWVTYTQVK